jgi:hypothetical protein
MKSSIETLSRPQDPSTVHEVGLAPAPELADGQVSTLSAALRILRERDMHADPSDTPTGMYLGDLPDDYEADFAKKDLAGSELLNDPRGLGALKFAQFYLKNNPALRSQLGEVPENSAELIKKIGDISPTVWVPYVRDMLARLEADPEGRHHLVETLKTRIADGTANSDSANLLTFYSNVETSNRVSSGKRARARALHRFADAAYAGTEWGKLGWENETEGVTFETESLPDVRLLSGTSEEDRVFSVSLDKAGLVIPREYRPLLDSSAVKQYGNYLDTPIRAAVEVRRGEESTKWALMGGRNGVRTAGQGGILEGSMLLVPLIDDQELDFDSASILDFDNPNQVFPGFEIETWPDGDVLFRPRKDDDVTVIVESAHYV